jgi:Ca2+/Na+ antiporter
MIIKIARNLIQLIMNKFYPLLSYKSKFIGIVSIVVGCILIAYSLFYRKINQDVAIWLICFGLFCIAYSREKDENSKYLLYRYHSFRISFALMTVIVLVTSSSFIFGNKPVKISCLYALLFLCLSYNILYLIIKKRSNKKPILR